jgi:hypothetical protein
MDSIEFKRKYYLKRIYQKDSDTEFYCRIVAHKREDDKEVKGVGIETRINISEVGQNIDDSQFYFNQITWENYLNQTIKMLFNVLMFRIQLSDLYSIDGNKSIASFFYEDPFYEE